MGIGTTLIAAVDFAALPQQLVYGILLGAIYALLALGYTMVYGVLRLINFAHGEVYMLGAYVSLFVSWGLGFTPEATRAGDRASSVINLGLMLIASMVVCGIIGVIIEYCAYRPMRSQPRIAALITAIGVSLLLQYGGSLFLPVSPQPSISEQVNPFSGTQTIYLKRAPADQLKEVERLQLTFDSTRARFDEQLKNEKSEFDLSATGTAMRDEVQTAEAELSKARNAVSGSEVVLRIPEGQLAMLVTSLILMLGLRHLVLKTKTGRAMRAVSHDFDSASLMGVSVNRIVMFTFLIGSALAGAGAMMTSTFLGTPLTTFYGVQPGVKAFVAAVLGGIGNVPGAVLGGLLMGIAEMLVVWVGLGGYRDAVALVVLIIVLLFRPGGLLGSAKVEKV